MTQSNNKWPVNIISTVYILTAGYKYIKLWIIDYCKVILYQIRILSLRLILCETCIVLKLLFIFMNNMNKTIFLSLFYEKLCINCPWKKATEESNTPIP